MADWPKITLGAICDSVDGIIRTGPFGSQLHQHDYIEDPDGLPVVMPKNITDGQIGETAIARIGPETAARLATHRMRPGDIVMARRGDIGRRALVDSRTTGWLCGTGSLRVSLPGSDLDPRFLYYFLGTDEAIGWLRGQAVGATMPNLNTDIIRRMEVPVPPPRVQRKIAAVLAAYDELIENNLRRTEILEEMAQAVYREWFVNLRFPGHEDVVLVDSPLGPIPEGWEVVTVSEAIELNPRVRLPRDQEIRFLPMGSLIEGSMVIDGHETRIGPSGSQFQNGDTLLARITPSLENGKTGFVQFLSENEVACGSTEFIVMRSQTLTPEFVYLLARTDDFRGVAVNSMVGASGRQRVQENSIARYPFPHPDGSTLQRFQEMSSPMFRMIQSLVEQNANLRSTRDLLLPKLVSGEIDVSDLDIDTEWLAS